MTYDFTIIKASVVLLEIPLKFRISVNKVVFNPFIVWFKEFRSNAFPAKVLFKASIDYSDCIFSSYIYTLEIFLYLSRIC